MMEGWMDRQVDGGMDGWMGGRMDRSTFMRIKHHPRYQINSDALLAVSVDYECLTHVTEVSSVAHGNFLYPCCLGWQVLWLCHRIDCQAFILFNQ